MQRFNPRRFAVMVAATLAGMALLFGLLAGSAMLRDWGQRLMPGYLSQDRFGDAWPLTVDDGRVECRPGRAVVFVVSGRIYAINGAARATGDGAYLPLEYIWRDDPHTPGAKVSISPVLDAGLALCRDG